MLVDFKMESAATDQRTITSVDAYLQAIKEIPKDRTVLYRGHAREDWKLQPSVGRMKKYEVEKEESIFLKFKMRYHLYTNDMPSTDIDTLFLAQHYGLPTRLLDWTDNPLIGLWFACQEEQEFDGCVYTIKAEKDHLQEDDRLNFDIFADKKTNFTENQEKQADEKNHSLIIPDYTNRRFLNQKGMFLWFKYPDISISKEQLKPSFIISKKHKKDILKELSNIGINEAFVYPDLEHLCENIKNEYEFE